MKPTLEEFKSHIKSLGVCNKNFVFQVEPESKTIIIKQRVKYRQPIVDGILTGCQMDVYDLNTIRVWTPKTKKAAALARTRPNYKIRMLSDECELFVPIAEADEILPQFGAYVRRTLSTTTKAKLSSRLATYRNNQK